MYIRASYDDTFRVKGAKMTHVFFLMLITSLKFEPLEKDGIELSKSCQTSINLRKTKVLPGEIQKN